MGTCAAMAASLSSPALSLQGSTIFDSPRLRRLTSAGCTSPLRKPTPFALGAAAAAAAAAADADADADADAARLLSCDAAAKG